MHRRLILPALALLVLALGAAAQPSEVELVLQQGADGYEGTRDTTVYSESSNGNGGGLHLFAGNTAQGTTRRALLAFDLGAIPEGARIASVSLFLTVSRTIAGPSAQSLHRLRADWGEGEAAGPGQEGTGAGAAEGDATWEENARGQSAWITPGGDFVAEPSAAAEAAGQGETVEWSGDGLVADVQAWVDGEAGHFGWILLGDEEGRTTAKRYHSSEGAEDARPRLVIRYRPAGL